MEIKDRIVRDPEICGGEAVVAGTRITIRTILASHRRGQHRRYPRGLSVAERRRRMGGDCV